MGPIPGALDLLVPAGALRIGIRRVVGRDHDAARRDERNLRAHERERILDVVDDEARDGGLERAGAKVEHGALVEPRVLAKPLAPLTRAPLETPKDREVSRAMDTVRARFGRDSIAPGRKPRSP